MYYLFLHFIFHEIQRNTIFSNYFYYKNKTILIQYENIRFYNDPLIRATNI